MTPDQNSPDCRSGVVGGAGERGAAEMRVCTGWCRPHTERGQQEDHEEGQERGDEPEACAVPPALHVDCTSMLRSGAAPGAPPVTVPFTVGFSFLGGERDGWPGQARGGGPAGGRPRGVAPARPAVGRRSARDREALLLA